MSPHDMACMPTMKMHNNGNANVNNNPNAMPYSLMKPKLGV